MRTSVFVAILFFHQACALHPNTAINVDSTIVGYPRAPHQQGVAVFMASDATPANLETIATLHAAGSAQSTMQDVMWELERKAQSLGCSTLANVRVDPRARLDVSAQCAIERSSPHSPSAHATDDRPATDDALIRRAASVLRSAALSEPASGGLSSVSPAQKCEQVFDHIKDLWVDELTVSFRSSCRSELGQRQALAQVALPIFLRVVGAKNQCSQVTYSPKAERFYHCAMATKTLIEMDTCDPSGDPAMERQRADERHQVAKVCARLDSDL